MYRKPRSNEPSSILNLDSLMDILSCLVGVMLFLVIYTVLELGSTSFEVSVPTPSDIPSDSRRMVVVANGGTVRVMDPRRPIQSLLSRARTGPLEEVPELVDEINRTAPTDDHFQYRLDFDEEAAVLDGQTRRFSVVVFDLPGQRGDSLAALEGPSTYARELARLDPQSIWLEFAIDSVSVDVFRRARDMAETEGFATRWEPWVVRFPVTFALWEDPDGPAPRRYESKARR